jgi:hypothetical protein
VINAILENSDEKTHIISAKPAAGISIVDIVTRHISPIQTVLKTT